MIRIRERPSRRRPVRPPIVVGGTFDAFEDVGFVEKSILCRKIFLGARKKLRVHLVTSSNSRRSQLQEWVTQKIDFFLAGPPARIIITPADTVVT